MSKRLVKDAAVHSSRSIEILASSAPQRPIDISTKEAEHCTEPRITDDQRQQMIAVAAYFRAERRGFCPGYEVGDWLEAEAEIDGCLGATESGSGSRQASERLDK